MDRQKIKIKSPCSQDFDEMQGEGHKRFCAQCEKHVHNLSDLTRDEALALLKENGASGLCVVYTFDANDRVRFREPAGFRRPPRRQLRGLKRLIAAAAFVPVLAALPACDPAPQPEEQVILAGYEAQQPCDLPSGETFKPIDEIMEAERKFVEGIKELLGFVPEYEVAGEPAMDPMVMGAMEPPPVVPEPVEAVEMGEVEISPQPVPPPPAEPPAEMMIMGDIAAPVDVINELENETD